jgi:hypothetical protein
MKKMEAKTARLMKKAKKALAEGAETDMTTHSRRIDPEGWWWVTHDGVVMSSEDEPGVRCVYALTREFPAHLFVKKMKPRRPGIGTAKTDVPTSVDEVLQGGSDAGVDVLYLDFYAVPLTERGALSLSTTRHPTLFPHMPLGGIEGVAHTRSEDWKAHMDAGRWLDVSRQIIGFFLNLPPHPVPTRDLDPHRLWQQVGGGKTGWGDTQGSSSEGGSSGER